MRSRRITKLLRRQYRINGRWTRGKADHSYLLWSSTLIAALTFLFMQNLIEHGDLFGSYEPRLPPYLDERQCTLQIGIYLFPLALRTLAHTWYLSATDWCRVLLVASSLLVLAALLPEVVPSASALATTGGSCGNGVASSCWGTTLPMLALVVVLASSDMRSHYKPNTTRRGESNWIFHLITPCGNS